MSQTCRLDQPFNRRFFYVLHISQGPEVRKAACLRRQQVFQVQGSALVSLVDSGFTARLRLSGVALVKDGL